MVARVAGVDAVGRRAAVLVTEDPGLDARQVRGALRAAAQAAEHRGGHVDRDDAPERPRGIERELARARAEVDDGRVRAEAVRREHRDVLGRIRPPLLAVVAVRERRVEVLRPGVGELVDHPVGCHGASCSARPRRTRGARPRAISAAAR